MSFSTNIAWTLTCVCRRKRTVPIVCVSLSSHNTVPKVTHLKQSFYVLHALLHPGSVQVVARLVVRERGEAGHAPVARSQVLQCATSIMQGISNKHFDGGQNVFFLSGSLHKGCVGNELQNTVKSRV